MEVVVLPGLEDVGIPHVVLVVLVVDVVVVLVALDGAEANLK